MKIKIRKNSWWNRLFYDLTEQKDRYNRCKVITSLYSELEKELRSSDHLSKLLEIHKNAWKWGFKNENLAPCSYGMFRTAKCDKGLSLK